MPKNRQSFILQSCSKPNNQLYIIRVVENIASESVFTYEDINTNWGNSETKIINIQLFLPENNFLLVLIAIITVPVEHKILTSLAEKSNTVGLYENILVIFMKNPLIIYDSIGVKP